MLDGIFIASTCTRVPTQIERVKNLGAMFEDIY